MSRAIRTGSLAFLSCLALLAQDFSVVKLQLIAKGYTFLEGPAWSKEGYLIFSDVPSDRLLKWTPGQGVEVLRKDSNGAAGNAFDAQGRLYTCETRGRRVVRTDKNGKLEVVAERWEGKRLNAPSHVAVGRNDQVYFTDPAFGSQADSRELDFNGVYHVPPKGPMKLVAKSTGRPNGIALSPNGRLLYVSNADEHNVRAYDVDKNGDTSNERVLITGIAGVPGGIHVDDKGHIFVAARGIAIYGADGRLLHTMEMHELPSACALGEDLKSLFITARGNLYRARLDGNDEQ
jgi:gluconolactonase